MKRGYSSLRTVEAGIEDFQNKLIQTGEKASLDDLWEYLSNSGYDLTDYNRNEVWRIYCERNPVKSNRLVSFHDLKAVDQKKKRKEEIIRSFFSTPDKRVYVDALNAAPTAEKVREIRRKIPLEFPLTVVARENDAGDLDIKMLEALKISDGIKYVYVPRKDMDDDYALLRLLCATDGLVISKDLFRNLKNEALTQASLRDHNWIDERRLEFTFDDGIVFDQQQLLDEVAKQERKKDKDLI
jgi:hypothetical protein